MVNRRIFVTVLCAAFLFAPLVSAQTRITDATTNGGTSRDSYDPRADGDGSRVAFRSDADLLSEGRADLDEEIWLWDDTTGFQRLTDALANGVTLRDSYLPAINDAGTRVAFQSDADMLSEGRAANDEEIWLWDETTGLQRLTDALANGGTSRDSYEAAVSPNGNRVAFRSDADLLSEGRASGNEEIWLWDETTGLQRLTDALANGGTLRDSYEPALSADGSRVVFQSDADMLSEGRASANEEIWLWDETTGLQRITDVLANGATGRDCYDAAINADGTRIVFRCDADLLSEGRADNDYEVWLWDETTGLQRITDTLANGATGRDCYDPEINAAGTLIVFESDADLLSQGIPDNQTEIWSYDTATTTLARVTIASGGDRDSFDADVSATGTIIVFESDSDFLTQGIPASQEEIWLSDGLPTAAITLDKTVDVFGSGCPGFDTIVVDPGTDVEYCYEVTNTGGITLSLHTLDDSELGILFTDLPFDLGPGASTSASTGAVNISATTTNTATWTASVPGGPSAVASDTATVTVVVPAQPGTCADFETGMLPAFAYAETDSVGGANGRVQVTTAYPNTGLYAVDIDTDCDGCGGNTTQAVVLVYNLAGLTEATLDFWVFEHGDENNPEDGVFISDDGGTTWALILNLNNQPANYVNFQIDLAAAATGAGMNLVDGFLIKFQSLDNFMIDLDGYSFDDICVYIPTEPDIDVDPLTMTSMQPPDTQTMQPLNINNIGAADLTWQINEDGSAPPPELVDWFENFDSYATGSQMHGQGGWKGWFNNPAGGALTSSVQSRSAPNSIDIMTTSDMVHEFSGSNSGFWVFTAWQYIPTGYTGTSYFIILNQYDDAGATLNWSTQVQFDSATNQVIATMVGAGPPLPLVLDQWVELRVEIDLVSDIQEFYYDNQLLSQGSWANGVSGGGILNIGAVNLFANGASSIFYDDLSLVEQFVPCLVPSDIPWLSTDPITGTVPVAGSQTVDVTFDSTGLSAGTYNANLCVESNDPDPGPGNGTELVIVPVELTVEVFPDIDVDPLSLAAMQPPGTITMQPMTIGNTGIADLTWDIFEEPLESLPMWPVAQQPLTRFDSEAALETEESGLEETTPDPSIQTNPVAAAWARHMLLNGGMLLIPDSTNDRVMSFDPTTGNLVDPDFIPADPTNLSTPKHAILSASGTSILVADQLDDVVQEYGMDGVYIGVFAPAGGVNNAILDNMRGISLDASGNLLVTVASGANQDAIAQFDTGGNYLGNFIANGAGGLDGPFDVYWRTSATDWLVPASTSDAVHRYDATGAYIADLALIDNFPQQVAEAGNSNVLVANFSGTQEGVIELTSAGAVVGIYDPPSLGGYRGAYELPNGNILTTNGSGVHEIDRSGNLVETKISGVSAQFIEYVASQTNCTNLADVPWLVANPASGTTPPAGSSPVDVIFDSTGLSAGSYDANLCVESNDPDPGPGNGTDLVVVPVSLTVQGEPAPLVCNGDTVAFNFGPPTDWTVIDNDGQGLVWTNLAACGETGNYTNGSGDCACASSDIYGMNIEYDTEMWSPPFDTTNQFIVRLDFTANYLDLSAGGDTFEVDVSTDGGGSWINVLSWDENHGGDHAPPGEDVTIDISAVASDQPSVIVRFHYFTPDTDPWDWYIQVDDASLFCDIPVTLQSFTIE